MKLRILYLRYLKENEYLLIMNKMFWEQMNRFANIKKFKSLSDAARKSNISQSTWSRDIGELEKNFGFKLIIRNYRGINLTEKGKILLKLIDNFKININNLRRDENDRRI